MKCIQLVLIFWLSYRNCQGGQDYEVIYPERLNNDRVKRDLSTNTDDGREKTATFAISAFQKKWILDIKHNDRLMPKSFLIRTFDSNDNEMISREAPESCHYQGSIRGIPDSVVVLDTCSGIRGAIDDGRQSYRVEPQEDYQVTGAHKIFKDEQQFDPNEHCGTQPDVNSFDSVSSEKSRLARTIENLRRGLGHVVDTEDVYRPYLTTNETRYTEVVFVVDNGVYERFKDTKPVINKVLTLCNAVDAVYQRINIRVVAIAIEIWTNGDRMQRHGKNGSLELSEFAQYRKKELLPKIPHDNAQFLSHHGWGKAAGMAYVGAMCKTPNSCAVNTFNVDNDTIVGPLRILAHEMGHNFGFAHSHPPCKCLTPKGCFMGLGGSGSLPGFTDCNLNTLKKKIYPCLFNVPEHNLNPKCGNGIKENDEECDCGTPEMCKLKDPCCQPHDCRLKPSSQCSDLHHTCCQDCQFKQQGTLCREVKTDCDVPEFCPGDSGDCPGDAYMSDGTPCNKTNELFIGNNDKNNIVSNGLSPRIQARYVRINPRYWNQLICMRTELLGCPADEAISPTMPTGLKPFMENQKLCIVPASESCSSSSKTYIKYKTGFECEESFMEFMLDASGILWHKCSNRRVCPESGKDKDGVKLMLSNNCQEDDSKFVRTGTHSLKHVKTGRCVQSKGKTAKNGGLLVLRSQCDEERLAISFIKSDCLIPLGIANGVVPDSQLTASSFKGDFAPSEARLFGKSRWCAGETKKNQYIQIDLGKTQTIFQVVTQGHGKFNSWVTGYHLYYSNDGSHWTGYTESGDALHSNSFCYTGVCGETRDTQCRDLWGAETKDADKGCYDKLNTEANGYGTCDPTSKLPCAVEDVLCGQIQCDSASKIPVKVDYGKSYKSFTLDDSKCSAAVLKTSDTLGQGMVQDGTKCGKGKMCKEYQCKSFAELNIKKCPVVDGKECNGQGVCTSTGVCHCYGLYDPKTGCKKDLVPQNGGFSSWSDWSKCTAGCNGGKQTRHRFCNNPFPMYGGKDCQGKLQEEQECNKDACPKANSCRHLQFIATSNNQLFPDGLYNIYPEGPLNPPIKTYCDMSRDGGGWTLLVSSATNTWTEDDVTFRNAGKPSLTDDYSILKYADVIKDNQKVQGSTFEYRLEANRPGRWGGIWEADRQYTFTAKDNKQINVRLLKKFDDWEYSAQGIDERMPWISGASLTTAKKNGFGSVTGNSEKYYPAPWIKAKMKKPEYIWYWMREGPSKLQDYLV